MYHGRSNRDLNTSGLHAHLLRMCRGRHLHHRGSVVTPEDLLAQFGVDFEEAWRMFPGGIVDLSHPLFDECRTRTSWLLVRKWRSNENLTDAIDDR